MTSNNAEGSVRTSLQPQQTEHVTPVSSEAPITILPNQLRTTIGTKSIESSKTSANGTSDRATAAFVRRTLCSHNVLLGNGERGRTTPHPIDEVLPSLTSSNEIDLQLYGIISVIIKDFVQAWYSKITPDHVFVNEVVQIIAHCTRALEGRIRTVDLESLLLDEIPELLEAHIQTYRMAQEQAKSPVSLASDPRLLYHIYNPHPALSPVPSDAVPSSIVEQRESESAWRQLLVQGVLAVLLPTDDLQNGCLRALVSEIFAEMIIGNGISGKACEGWLLWEGITTIAKALQDNSEKEAGQSPKQTADQPMTRLERFGLLSQGKDDTLTTAHPRLHRERYHETISAHVSNLFWALIQCMFVAWIAVRAAIKLMATSSSLPLRTNYEPPSTTGIHQSDAKHAKAALAGRTLTGKRPIVSMRLWSCIARIIELDVRMPWLSGSISMLYRGLLVGPGKVGCTDHSLDRLLSDAIHKRVLNPALMPSVLRTIRATILPNNSLGPPRQPPSADEARAIKRRCAASLLDLMPKAIAAAFFSTRSRNTHLDDVERTLSCLDDPYLNKHLIFQVIELILLRLVPELGEQGVRAMVDARLG